MKRAMLLAVAGAAWIGLPAPVRACSVTAGYLRPSNFELVRDSEAIALARAVRGLRKDDRVDTIVFDVVQVLKGTIEEKTLNLPGHDHWFGPSDPGDFSQARPGAGKGACIAYDYKIGSQFILFLRREGRRWEVRSTPFTRVNEEVSGPEAPWAKAVVHYARISALGTVELQKAALRRLADEGGKIDGLIQDIDRHFHGPHGSKPFEDLKKLYDDAPNDAARDRVLWAFSNGKHAAAAELIRGLIRSGDWTRFAEPVADFVVNLCDSSCVDPLLKSLAPDQHVLPAEQRWGVLWAVAKTGDASNGAGLRALLKTVTDEETRPLIPYFVRYPDPESTAELIRRIGRNYEERHEMTFGIAAMGERDVVAWALATAKKSEGRWIPNYVLAISPLPEADRGAQEILKGSDLEAIAALAQGYGQSRSPHRIERLLEAYELRRNHRQLDLWVRRSLSGLSEEGDREAEQALKKLPPPPEEDR